MNHRRQLTAALALLTFPIASRAWESRCYDHPDEGLEPAAYASASDPRTCDPEAGPNVMHHRWVGPLDEHRQIFERTLAEAGLPASLAATIRLRVFTSDAHVTVGHSYFPSYAPVPFATAVRAQTRAYSLGEMSELPDFAYSLWDWADGGESCPLAGAANDPVDCHAFATHMGPVNANHFVPQSQAFYRRGHAMAIARMAECRALATRIAGSEDRFGDYVRGCETEALTIEAVAQHYLQDAWSMGHMWQRWGAPDLDALPGRTDEERRARAVLIALAAGLIHGARAILQALPSWTTYDVDDALCAPSDPVRFSLHGRVEHGAGDGYLAQLFDAALHPNSPLAFQYQQMMRCASAGVLEVYRAGPQASGALRSDVPFANPGIDPTGPDCFDQRATNEAMLTGAGVQYRILGSQSFLVMDARFVSWALPTAGTTGGHVDIDPLLRNMYRLELSRAVSMLRVYAHGAPMGIDAADGGLGDVLGIHPNGAYLNRPLLAEYEDPELPWPATHDAATPSAAVRARDLAEVFHRAHVADWCARTNGAALESLRVHVRETERVPDAHAAACEVCAEFAARHLRLGAPGRYDRHSEPVCTVIDPTSAVVYQPPGGPGTVAPASAWCGCGPTT